MRRDGVVQPARPGWHAQDPAGGRRALSAAAARGLAPSGTVPVLAHVDDQPPVRREARTQEDGVLITLLAGDLEALARGRSIKVALPQAAITYPLTGSFAALNTL